MMVKNVVQMKSGITINVGVSARKTYLCKIDYIWIHATCTCENDKYVESITNDSAIMCNEIIDGVRPEALATPANSYEEATKGVPTKNASTQSTSTKFFILVIFSLIDIALLIAVSIYCYLMKYQAKQKYLLPYHESNNKLK